MNTKNRYSPEVRERAVRLVHSQQSEHSSQWAAIGAIVPRIGCAVQTWHGWVRQAERDQGIRGGSSTGERERLEAIERENRGLKRAKEILRKALAYFAQAELSTAGTSDGFVH